MGKVFLLLLVIVGVVHSAPAQKGNNQLRLLAELGFPTIEYPTGAGADDYRTGKGVYAKFLYGVGQSGRLSLTTGYAWFKNETFPSLSLRTLPVLAGYQFHLGAFYVEPQAGYGVMSGHEYDYLERHFYRYSIGALYFGLGGGYEHKRWDAGIRVQRSGAIGARRHSHFSAFQFVGVHVGYALWQTSSEYNPGP